MINFPHLSPPFSYRQVRYGQLSMLSPRSLFENRPSQSGIDFVIACNAKGAAFGLLGLPWVAATDAPGRRRSNVIPSNPSTNLSRADAEAAGSSIFQAE
jgi:hypothetical protein